MRLANGREASALEIQREYFDQGTRLRRPARASTTGIVKQVLDLWERTLHAVETGDLDLVATRDRLGDQAPADRALPGQARPGAVVRRGSRRSTSPTTTSPRERGLYYLLQKRGQVERVASDLEIFEAKSVPPQTTRARLRGEFIRRAQEQRRDFTVDWVHLKLNDQAQRTVLCKDPFRSVDERVEKLIASM